MSVVRFSMPKADTWWPARKRLSLLAIATATVTGGVAAMLGGSTDLAAAYVLVTLVALLSPAAIAVQVVVGQVLLGSLLMAGGRADPLALVPVFASVVATAELLADVARMDTPFESERRGDLHQVGLATVVGGGAFGAVVLVGDVPGPTGVLAVALASGACVVLARLLVRGGP